MATDASWPDSGRTRPRNTAQRCATVSVVRARRKACVQVVGALGTVYGSEGWWFESLRARQFSGQPGLPAGELQVIQLLGGDDNAADPYQINRVRAIPGRDRRRELVDPDLPLGSGERGRQC
jgi:hypothetical protein